MGAAEKAEQLREAIARAEGAMAEWRTTEARTGAHLGLLIEALDLSVEAARAALVAEECEAAWVEREAEREAAWVAVCEAARAAEREEWADWAAEQQEGSHG